MRALALLLVASSAFAAPRNFTLITTNGPIGTMVVSQKSRSYEITWRVDNNGRGPKLDEKLELAPDGAPVKWEVSGKGGVGAPVKESFTSDGKIARWTSLDGGGEAETKGALYLVNDGTPFAFEVYLKALLSTKELKRAGLPGGSLQAEKLRDVTLGKEKLSAWAIWGLGTRPELVLARRDQLVAVLSGSWGILVEDSLKGQFDALKTVGLELRTELLRKLTARLSHTVEGPLFITNVRVFDPVAQRIGAPTNVGVFHDTIVYVGSDAPPADASTVDGEGGTLLPGLTDAHAHYSDWAGPLHLARGVLLVRDPGNDNLELRQVEKRIELGHFLGPRISKSGFIEGKSPFSAHNGFVVDSLEQALERVRWYAMRGFLAIKIYNSMKPEWVAPIAAEAHRLGLRVHGHVPAFMTPERAVRDGYDEITHLNQLALGFIIDAQKEDTRTPFRFTALGERTARLDLDGEPVQRMMKLMKEKRTVLDPTMATMSKLVLSRPGRLSPADAGWLEHMPQPVQRVRQKMLLDVRAEQFATYDASWKKLEELLLRLHKAGVPMVPGTDDAPGVMLHSELEMWVRAGIPAAATLSAATLGGAKLLGLEAKLGTIAPGKLADLYLVEGDPIKDIGAIRKGRLTLKSGVAYYPDEIDAAIGIKPFAARAAIVPPGGKPGASH